MSRVLCDAVIRALKEAHDAYLVQNAEKYRENMKVAECGMEAIRSLGVEEGCGRQMELMGLQAAVLQMLLPPSRVIPKEAPLLPHCENTLDFFGGACDRTAENLDRASGLYGRLTGGGGGGVAEIYRAEVAWHRGEHDKASYWAKLALERMCGDRWIEAIAMRLIADAERDLMPEHTSPQPQRLAPA